MIQQHDRGAEQAYQPPRSFQELWRTKLVLPFFFVFAIVWGTFVGWESARLGCTILTFIGSMVVNGLGSFLVTVIEERIFGEKGDLSEENNSLETTLFGFFLAACTIVLQGLYWIALFFFPGVVPH